MPAYYATGVIAKQLGISKTSLQHYIQILEEHGYKIIRNSRMHRQFTETDLDLLRSFLILYKNKGYKLKNAAETVLHPDFKLIHDDFYSPEVQQLVTSPIQPNQFEDISNSMQLMATHIYGIEQQNSQLITLIEEQRTQNELLLEQNQTLKQQLGTMMQYMIEQTNSPNHQKQLDRVEQQNSAIMNVLNKLKTEQFEAENQQPISVKIEMKESKGLFSKLFK